MERRASYDKLHCFVVRHHSHTIHRKLRIAAEPCRVATAFLLHPLPLCADRLYLRGEIGWGGRIRTFTVLINSEVSYQLDHAPEDRQNIIGLKHFPEMHPTGIHC